MIYPGENLNAKFAAVTKAAKAAYYDALKPHEEMTGLLDYIQSQGKSMHVYTASATGRALDKLHGSGLSKYFDKVFTGGSQAFDDLPTSGLIPLGTDMSKVIGLPTDTKLRGLGHQTVLDKLGAKAENVAITGDSLAQDIEPAKKLRMLGVQANWFIKETADDILPDLVINTPGQMTSILKQALGR